MNEATGADDLRRWLDGNTLRRLWPSLWLPAGYGRYGEARLPELATRRRHLDELGIRFTTAWPRLA